MNGSERCISTPTNTMTKFDVVDWNISEPMGFRIDRQIGAVDAFLYMNDYRSALVQLRQLYVKIRRIVQKKDLEIYNKQLVDLNDHIPAILDDYLRLQNRAEQMQTTKQYKMLSKKKLELEDELYKIYGSVMDTIYDAGLLFRKKEKSDAKAIYQ